MTQAIKIDSHLEPLFDDCLIEETKNCALRLHSPQPQPMTASPIRGSYMTLIRDGGLYRAYFRAYLPGFEGPIYDGNPGEITCCAESYDGIEWHVPQPPQETGSSPVIYGQAMLYAPGGVSHNFTPFLDTKPGIDPAEKYKALGGMHPNTANPEQIELKYNQGLYFLASADGLKWRFVQPEPLISPPDKSASIYAFDSQNIAFWSEAENCYVCYYRTWSTPHGTLRTISRSTSPDFRSWSAPQCLAPNLPGEHLYTSCIQPYFRAPQVYIALPTRFMEHLGCSTEVVFMTSRAGAPFLRPFREAFIRPGLDPHRWGNRANYAALNVIPTGPTEMSIYHTHSGQRYTLRTDGFASLHAGHGGGTMLTKPLVFTGERLILNASTAASGRIRAELRTLDGSVPEGFSLDDCVPLTGDALDLTVKWKSNRNLASFAERPVRLFIELFDSDIYALQFCMI